MVSMYAVYPLKWLIGHDDIDLSIPSFCIALLQ